MATVNIAGEYTNVNITDAGGTARVEVLSDSTKDLVTIKNARLTATADTTPDFKIEISATGLTTQPETDGPPLWYWVQGWGEFENPLRGNYIKIKGVHDNPPNHDDQQIGAHLQRTVPCSFPFAVCKTISPDPIGGYFVTNTAFTLVDQGRDLKGEILVKLSANRKVRIDHMEIADGEAPGEGPPLPNGPKKLPKVSKEELTPSMDCLKCVFHGDINIDY